MELGAGDVTGTPSYSEGTTGWTRHIPGSVERWHFKCLARQKFATNDISTPAFAGSTERGNFFAMHQILGGRLIYKAYPLACFVCPLIRSQNFNSFTTACLTYSYIAIFVGRHCSGPAREDSPNLSPILLDRISRCQASLTAGFGRPCLASG